MVSRPAGELLAVGRVWRPHGVRGDVLVAITTDFPERIEAGIEVGIGAATAERWLRLESARIHKGCFLVHLAGISTRDEADALRGAWVFLPAQKRSSLPANYYYEHELAGLDCVGRDGATVGKVVELGSGTGTAMLTVRTPKGDVLVPFISPIVVKVDLKERKVVIDPPKGLVDDDAL